MKHIKDVNEFALATPDQMAQDAIWKADREIQMHDKIVASISGGSDSDIMLDLLHRLDRENKITYIWFDTGLEYEATKRHLKELEEEYGIHIYRIKTPMPVPLAVRRYGLPFLSKQVSEMISRLQAHNFEWEDGTLEELLKKYPKCKVALRWWCNDWGENSRFNISYNTCLKEFLIENPPQFPISNRCCHFAKKP